MEPHNQDERFIREYVLAETQPGEVVRHAEKIASRALYGTIHEVWDVRTSRGRRWWVITEPTNLYSQTDFQSMEVALTYHIGLGMLLAARNAPPVDEDEVLLAAEPWRRWQEAADDLDEAIEVGDFNAVGVRCREALLALTTHHARPELVPAGQAAPQAGNFVEWAGLIANHAARGSSKARIRSYLKTQTQSTWELVGWLTHAKNAGRSDGRLVVEATAHAIAMLVNAVIARERQAGRVDPRCPSCGSRRLVEDYRPELGRDAERVTRCRACGFEATGPVEEHAGGLVLHHIEPDAD